MRFFALFIFTCFTILSAQSQQVVAYTNAQVFDGQQFTKMNFWTVDNRITFSDPKLAGLDFNVEDRFVVPAYGDAFSLSLSDFNEPEQYLRQYKTEGVMFVNAFGHSMSFEAQARKFLNAQSPEVRFSNGTLTWAGAYPATMWDEVVERRKQNAALTGLPGPTGIGDNYWVVGDKESLARDWPKILEQKPDFICMYMPDAAYQGKKGSVIDEKTLKAVAKSAKKAKSKLVLVIGSKSDFSKAVSLKPHLIVGLPIGNSEAATLTAKDFAALKKSKAYVAPCFFSQMRELAGDPVRMAATGCTSQKEITEKQSAVFKELVKNDIPFVLASGDPSRSTMPELNQWVQLGVNENLKFLRAISERTQECIYPGRKTGRIVEGYEANFLILSGDPSTNIQKARIIHKVVKAGKILEDQSMK